MGRDEPLRNLIGNAIDHTAAERGLVRMLVETAPDGRIRFVVEDDGPGIPFPQRERIFDRFYRTDAARDRASGGTGLGLAIVRAIAEAHGGRIAAGRSPEGGARIEIELPRFTVGARPAYAPGPVVREAGRWTDRPSRPAGGAPASLPVSVPAPTATPAPAPGIDGETVGEEREWT